MLKRCVIEDMTIKDRVDDEIVINALCDYYAKIKREADQIARQGVTPGGFDHRELKDLEEIMSRINNMFMTWKSPTE
jgi:hypothetical protein